MKSNIKYFVYIFIILFTSYNIVFSPKIIGRDICTHFGSEEQYKSLLKYENFKNSVKYKNYNDAIINLELLANSLHRYNKECHKSREYNFSEEKIIDTNLQKVKQEFSIYRKTSSKR